MTPKRGSCHFFTEPLNRRLHGQLSTLPQSLLGEIRVPAGGTPQPANRITAILAKQNTGSTLLRLDSFAIDYAMGIDTVAHLGAIATTGLPRGGRWT